MTEARGAQGLKCGVLCARRWTCMHARLNAMMIGLWPECKAHVHACWHMCAGKGAQRYDIAFVHMASNRRSSYMWPTPLHSTSKLHSSHTPENAPLSMSICSHSPEPNIMAHCGIAPALAEGEGGAGQLFFLYRTLLKHLLHCFLEHVAFAIVGVA